MARPKHTGEGLPTIDHGARGAPRPMTEWRDGYRPPHVVLELAEAAELYQKARRDYQAAERFLEGDPGNPERRQALEQARRARQQAWTTWLNLARPSA